jgi:hypothetical protein
MAFDSIDNLAMAPLLALHVYGNDGVKRWHQPQQMENKPQQNAWDDQRHIEDGRERLPVQQETQRGKEDRQNVDHGGAEVRGMPLLM